VPPTPTHVPPTPTPLRPARKTVGGCEEAKPVQICVRDAATGRVTRVTDGLEFGQIDRLAWSPNGQQIVFGADSGIDHKLYVINADGSGLRQLTGGDTNDILPAWSPDEQWIAFHRNCDLWLIHPDGSEAQRLLEGSPARFCAEFPAWSSDSQRITLSNTLEPGAETARREIWVVNRDGSDPRTVYTFAQPTEWVQVAWSPDGRQIACWYRESGEEKALLINADGSGEPQPMERDKIPRSWFPDFWPPWGGTQ
jgi:Tol biopolymer transport system component